MKTKVLKSYQPKLSDLNPQWHLVDAIGIPLGRLASEIAKLLIGKHKPIYAPHLNCGDYVIVINSDHIALSGNKNSNKIYYRHSGYVGNLRSLSFEQQRAKDSRKIISMAVAGMLPKNKLRNPRLTCLHIYSGDQHPHQAQKPTAFKLKQRKIEEEK